MLPGRSLPMHPGDQRILEIARELCQQLNIYKFNLRFVTWVGRMGLRQIPSDYMMIYRDTIWLPRSLMEKLEPEDWRPLLASALIYYSTYQRRTFVRMLTTFLPVVLISLIAFVSYFRLVGVSSLASRAVSYVLIASFVGVEIYVMIRWFRGFKRIYLEADDRATRLVGREVFLKTLEKVQSFGTAKGPPLRTYPSVPERIRNLYKTNIDANQVH
jgi:hypothetical protein